LGHAIFIKKHALYLFSLTGNASHCFFSSYSSKLNIHAVNDVLIRTSKKKVVMLSLHQSNIQKSMSTLIRNVISVFHHMCLLL